MIRGRAWLPNYTKISTKVIECTEFYNAVNEEGFMCDSAGPSMTRKRKQEKSAKCYPRHWVNVHQGSRWKATSSISIFRQCTALQCIGNWCLPLFVVCQIPRALSPHQFAVSPCERKSSEFTSSGCASILLVHAWASFLSSSIELSHRLSLLDTISN